MLLTTWNEAHTRVAHRNKISSTMLWFYVPTVWLMYGIKLLQYNNMRPVSSEMVDLVRSALKCHFSTLGMYRFLFCIVFGFAFIFSSKKNPKISHGVSLSNKKLLKSVFRCCVYDSICKIVCTTSWKNVPNLVKIDTVMNCSPWLCRRTKSVKY